MRISNNIIEYFQKLKIIAQELKYQLQPSKKKMHNHEHAVENLYEIPNCTICLSELSQDLTNLGCGHVFHLNCISQHFQYRGTCPNCQKRSNSKEIRMVVYQLTRNTQSASLLRQVIGNLPPDNQQQMQALFKQFHGANQRNERLERQNAQLQKQQKKLITELDLSKTECNRVKIDLAELRKVNVELKNVIEHLHSEIKRLNEQNFNMAQVVEQYKENKAEYQKLRKLKKILAEKSASLISYKNELQNQGTRPQQMAKQFFEMVQIKHLDIIKLKSEMQSHPQRLQQKDDQIEKLRSIVSKYKAEVKDLQEKRAAEKKKFEDTKVKYKNLAEKYKAIRANQLNQPESQQQNFEDSLLSRPSFPLGPAPKLNTSNISFNSNSNGSNPISRARQQNDPFAQNRASKKNITQHFDNTMIIEEESDKASSTVKNTFEKKPATQGTLNGFVQLKPQMGSFGSFGGLAAKKKSEDNRKPAMRNIFG